MSRRAKLWIRVLYPSPGYAVHDMRGAGRRAFVDVAMVSWSATRFELMPALLWRPAVRRSLEALLSIS